MKHNNIQVMVIPEREEKEQGIEILFEKIMTEKFPNLESEKIKKHASSGSQRVSIKMDPKRLTPRHIIIKIASIKDKERILKAARAKQEVTYKGDPIRVAADFLTETIQSRREWKEIFQVMKNKGFNRGYFTQ